MESWGVGAKAFLTEVSSRAKQVTGNARSTEFLRQRVGIEIQRGNAAAVMGTVDSTKEWSNLFLSLLLSFLFTFRHFGLFSAVGQDREFVFPQISGGFEFGDPLEIFCLLDASVYLGQM